MILFVNQSTRKIEDSTLNTIPIEITTDIVLKDSVGISAVQAVDDNGNLLYTNKEGAVTTSSWSKDEHSILEPLDFNDVNVIDGELHDIDEDINIVDTVDNTPYLEDVPFIKEVQLTKENAHNYSIDEIMTIEFYNLLEQSQYNNVLYNILDNILYTMSTFYSCNMFRVILSKDDKVVLHINQRLSAGTRELFIKGIESGAKVYINTVECTQRNGGYRAFIAGDVDEITIEISNKSNRMIEINNPFILFN